ncbi:MAG: hypothetical protein DLM59_15910 [Pseudonocardiales bacterium]|nr:MAG: hypothetical protein DLM59_15910 [Pseudonocardiales bacterium]
MSAGRPIAEQSSAELFGTWEQWSLTSTLTDATVGRQATGHPEHAAVLASWLDREPRIDPLDALAANHRLARLLTGWQWLAIHAARTHGAGWEQIGEKLDTGGEQARAGYQASIDDAERYTPDFFTAAHAAAYRAVLDDTTPSAGPGPTTANGWCRR